MNTDYEELYKWIEEHEITRPKRNINRDFSDASKYSIFCFIQF